MATKRKDMERQTILLLTSVVAKLTKDVLSLKEENENLKRQNEKLLDDQKLLGYALSRNNELTRQIVLLQEEKFEEKKMSLVGSKEPWNEYETFTSDDSLKQLPVPDIESTRLDKCSEENSVERVYSTDELEYEPYCYDCNDTDCWGCVFTSGETSTQSQNDVNYKIAVLDFFDYSSDQSISDSNL